MSDTIKISQLTQAAATGSTDELPMNQGGVTKKANPGQLSTDWKSITGTISGLVYNGNGSYTGTMSADNTGSISPGMRFRSTLAAAAQTKCLLLNGTNQYATKVGPNGMTFTDDFVVSAWVKLTSYQFGMIASRYNGTSGWYLAVGSDGRVFVNAFNGGSANFSQVISYQSLPLNKWVHVTAQLDMSAFTATSTTSYIMLDGVDVPSSVTRGGTNPTALVQAGNLEVGSANAANFFPGKIAQVAIFSAKVTQATMRGYISQGMTGIETSLVSAYSFDNSLNDLNTTNANNLTAMNGASANTSDSFRGIQAGDTNSTLYDYFIVMAITPSTITLQAANGCTLSTTASTLSAFHYATVSNPYGFPGQRDKWQIITRFDAGAVTVPTAGVVYNLGSLRLSIPSGEWSIGFNGTIYYAAAASNTGICRVALSTSASALPTDKRFLTATYVSASGASSSAIIKETSISLLPVSLSAQTPYYLVGYSQNTIQEITLRTEAPTVITAENAYL